MPLSALDLAAREVLGRYALSAGQARLVKLGNHGGFSGACLWRTAGAGDALCLRAWPPGEPTPQTLSEIHRLMRLARDSGLDVVPAPAFTRDGKTWVEQAGRLWELTAWMPGHADFRQRPTCARLEAACTLLARLHVVWAGASLVTRPCPGVRRRLERAREWIRLIGSGWHLPQELPDDRAGVHSWARRAWALIRNRIDDVPRLLEPWSERRVAVQPCLCDVRVEHLIFRGDAITGLVDFGAVKPDHVAVDLARLLGSLVGDNPDLRVAGLRAYREIRPLAAEEEELVGLLDATGTLLGAANWLRWLYRDKRSFEDQVAVGRRLAELVERMEQW